MRSHVSRIAPVLAGALLLLSPLSSLADTFYVNPSGSDNAPGSLNRPWRTIDKAGRALQPGDVVLIDDGQYRGGITAAAAGAPGNPVTYKAIHPGKVIVRGDLTADRDAFTVMETHDVVVDGLTFTQANRCGIWVCSSDNVVVRNCLAINNGVQGIFTSFSNDLLIENNECCYSGEQHGIYVSNSGDRPTLRHNICHHNAICGIQLNGDGKQQQPDLGVGGDGIIENATLVDNICYENGQANKGAAINLLCVHHGFVANNLVYNNQAGGISLYNDNLQYRTEFGSKDIQIVNNTVYFKPNEGRWCVSFSNGSTDNVVLNNILYGGAKGAYQTDNDSSFFADYNLIHEADIVGVATNVDAHDYYDFGAWQTLSGNDLHSSTANPRFASATAPPFDFRPTDTSPALDAGTPYPLVTDDLLGAPRDPNYPSIGCYEVSAGLLPPVRLRATVDSGMATLRWAPRASGCAYTIKRAKGSSGDYQVVATGVTKLIWVDTGVVSGRSYSYVIDAVHGNVTSDDSDSLQVDIR